MERITTINDDTLSNSGPQSPSQEASHVLLDFSQKLSLVDDREDVGSQNIVVSEAARLPSEKQRLGSAASQNIEIASEKSTVAESNEAEERLKFTCSCGERFEKSVQLASHRRWSCKLKEKTAQCEVCNNWFASEVGLRRHMKHAHGGIVRCDSCNLRFPNKIKLTRHWIEAHHDDNGEESKPLRCYVCGDTNFDSKFELECHLVVHKYEKHQEKLSQQGPSAPYPPPCLRQVLTQHHRPPWPFFPFHRPPFPFHHPPHVPFLHHIPFPPPFPASLVTPATKNSTPIKEKVSPCATSTADESDFISEHDSHSAASHPPGHDSQSAATHHPRHDHTYLEPTVMPPFFPPHLFKHHHHHGSHGKNKWKKYLKLMMKGKVPPLLLNPPYGKLSDVDECQSSSSLKEKVDGDKCEFKIACKFCDKVIQRNKVAWHQRRECPVLSVHRCAVCDRVFRKRHFLIRHMHEQNHYSLNSQVSDSVATSSDAVSSSLSVLQENMNKSLHLLNVSSTPASQIGGEDEPADKSDSCAMPSDGDCGENINPRLKATAAERIQCSICRLYYHSKEQLFEHLKDHINQVLTIQKVQEWTLKSSDYFFLNDPDDDRDGDTVTSATTSTSCLDSEITSTTDGTIPDGHFSSLDSVVSGDPKWSKPHRKKNSHRHKGEVLMCEFCSEQFGFRKDLHFHMETKHKDSTLKCPVCKKKFSWKKRGKFYERHLNSHYGVKVFKHKCETCGKTFLENSKLKAHMSLHNTELLHRCAVCKKGYANKSSLVRHERKHTGVKPYQCQMCPESFMEKRELLRHSTTHTGVAPFSCNVCGQGFTLKTSFMSHMKKKHSKP